MKRLGFFLGMLAAGLAGTVVAQQPQGTFRSTVDVLTLDVSVLDQNRLPIRGLTQNDFTVEVDKQARPVVAFKTVELPPPVPPPLASWVRDVAPDVVSNARPAGRVVVIVIDDGSFSQADQAAGPSASGVVPVVDQWGLQRARGVARAAVDQLGPDDLAAVVFTENNTTAQGLTADRQRLLTAIDTAALFPGTSGGGGRPLIAPNSETRLLEADRASRMADTKGIERGACVCGVCSIESLGKVAASLRALERQRKIVIYISAGVAVSNLLMTPQDPSGTLNLGGGFEQTQTDCTSLQGRALRQALREAQTANVVVMPVDPKGLTIGSSAMGLLRGGFLRAIGDNTGGRTVMNTNDMEREVPALFAENGSYYLLGVDPPVVKDDGTFHNVRVTVNRPGVVVRTRSGFYAPTPEERKAMAAKPSRGLDATIEGTLPKSDLPLEVTVLPFAEANGKTSIAVALSVTQPVDAQSRRSRRMEGVEIIASAFEAATGKGVGFRRQKADVELLPTRAPDRQFEVFTRLPVPPGRYELRLGLQTSSGQTASVFTYAEVPNFATETVSLSGIVFNSTPAPKSAPKDLLIDLTPLAPTAWRSFQKTDRVIAYARVYEGGSDPIAPVEVTTSITDARNQRISRGGGTLSPAVFKGRIGEYRFQVPVDRLQVGEYLLAIHTAIGEKSAERSVRFKIR